MDGRELHSVHWCGRQRLAGFSSRHSGSTVRSGFLRCCISQWAGCAFWRFIRCFWGLDKNLANARHYPAISWTDSYSEYAEEVDGWFCSNVDARWGELREEVRNILAEDNKIQQVIKLVGEDVLPDDQRLIAFTAFLIKNGYLQQNSFGSDSYSPPIKGFEILSVILEFHHKAMELVRRDIPISLIKDDESVDSITHWRELAAEDKEGFDQLRKRIDAHLERVAAERTRKLRGGE